METDENLAQIKQNVAKRLTKVSEEVTKAMSTVYSNRKNANKTHLCRYMTHKLNVEHDKRQRVQGHFRENR